MSSGWSGGGNSGYNGSSGDDSGVMYIQGSEVGVIIGRGGSKIRELQERSGAQIKIDKNQGGGETRVDLIGSYEAQCEAKRMIQDALQEQQYSGRGGGGDGRGFGGGGRGGGGGGGGGGGFGGDGKTIYVQATDVGKIIGRGGAKIRELEDRSGANIKIDKNSGGRDVGVKLLGSPEAQGEAQRLIEELCAEYGGDRGGGRF